MYAIDFQPSTRMILMGTKKSRFEEHIGIIKELMQKAVNSNWPPENLLDMVCAINTIHWTYISSGVPAY